MDEKLSDALRDAALSKHKQKGYVWMTGDENQDELDDFYWRFSWQWSQGTIINVPLFSNISDEFSQKQPNKSKSVEQKTRS